MNDAQEERIAKAITVSIPVVIKIIQIVLTIYAKWKEAKAKAEELARAIKKAEKDRHNAEMFRKLRDRLREDWEKHNAVR